MIKHSYQRLLLLSLSILLIGLGCSKKNDTPPTPAEKLPAPRTDAVLPDSIAAVSAFVSGSFSSTGGSNFTETGFCWSTNALPTIADSYVDVPYNGLAIFTRITGLHASTKYYVRAFGKNSAGLAYGNSVAFTTLTLYPLLQINGIFKLSSNYADIDCKILSQGNSPIIASGICWSSKPNPTINDDTTKSSQSSGEFVPSMTGLKVNTKYYVRAYATNNDGTGYSDTISVIPEYYIGQVFGGGKIFYIAPNKVHGLIAANDDQALGDAWDYNSNVQWTYAWDANDGASNTDKIIKTLGTGSYAAALCRNYTGGGYSDWYLPSLNELGDLFLAKDKIGNITPGYYWSSTEDQNYIASAWVIRMDSQTGEQQTWTKNYQYAVRAVRKF